MAPDSHVGKRGATTLGKRKRKNGTYRKQVVDKMDSPSQQVANGDIPLSGRKHIEKTALRTKKRVPFKISSEFVEKLKAMEGQVMALKRMVTELRVKKGLQPTMSPVLQSTINLESNKNLQSTKKMQSTQNLRSTKNRQSTQNLRSTKNQQSTKNVQSTQSLQSTKNLKPSKNQQSTKNLQSTKNDQSTQNLQLTKNLKPSKNRQSTKKLQSTKNVQSTKNMQSTKSLQSTKNLQTDQNLQLTLCVESTQNGQAIEPWDAIGDIAQSYLDSIELNNNNHPSVTLHTKFPEGWSECELASPKPGNPIVATGKVFNTFGSQPVMLHNKPLEPGYMKVTITDPKVKTAPLPMPDDQASTVLEAVGALIAWPTSLISQSTNVLCFTTCEQNESIVSETLIALKFQSTPLNPVIQSASEINDDVNFIKGKKTKGKRTQVKRKAMNAAPTIQTKPSQTNQLTVNQEENLNTKSNQVNVNQHQMLTTLSMKLMYRCVRGMTCEDKITIDMPETVWQDDHNILITKDELLQWLFQRSVGASHVSIYIKYLYNLCHEQGMSKMFVFLRPQMLSSDAIDADDEEVQYIANAMEGANRSQIYFAPYNDGRHWMLCVIHPLKDQAYWLDPAGNEAHPYVKKVVQMAIRKFYFQKRRKKSRGKSQWFEIKCPLQLKEDDSGYYVLRYMQEVVEKRQDFIPEQYYEDSAAPSCYEQKHIDEVRDKWIEYVQNHMD